jgi:hypothetical protein
MKVIIQGARCDISEATAIAVLYPDYVWCDTLEQARKQQQQDQQAEANLWSIEDYDVFSDVFKSIYGMRPRWISREEFERRKVA